LSRRRLFFSLSWNVVKSQKSGAVGNKSLSQRIYTIGQFRSQ
jgi:hypothetical protein